MGKELPTDFLEGLKMSHILTTVKYMCTYVLNLNIATVIFILRV